MLRPQKRRFICAVKGCEMEVINLPRHLQQRPHHWSKESAMVAVSLFMLRKPGSKMTSFTKTNKIVEAPATATKKL